MAHRLIGLSSAIVSAIAISGCGSTLTGSGPTWSLFDTGDQTGAIIKPEPNPAEPPVDRIGRDGYVQPAKASAAASS